jgi:hypothetical protein
MVFTATQLRAQHFAYAFAGLLTFCHAARNALRFIALQLKQIEIAIFQSSFRRFGSVK